MPKTAFGVEAGSRLADYLRRDISPSSTSTINNQHTHTQKRQKIKILPNSAINSRYEQIFFCLSNWFYKNLHTMKIMAYQLRYSGLA